MKKSKVFFAIIGLIIIILAILSIIIYYQYLTSNSKTNTEYTICIIIDYQTKKTPPVEVYNLTVVRGTTAYEAFNQVAELQVRHYPYGVFIEGVNGYMATPPNYWAFYYRTIDDEMWLYSEVGVSMYIVGNGDSIKLLYTEVKLS